MPMLGRARPVRPQIFRGWVEFAAPPVEATADPAVLVLTGVDPTFAGSGVSSTTADTATLALAGVDAGLAGSGAVSVSVDVAALTFAGVDAELSSGGVAVTADPATLTFTGVDATLAGTGFLFLPNTDSWVSTPDHASLAVTDGLDVRIFMAPTTWSGAFSRHLIGQRGTASTAAWVASIHSNGRPRLAPYEDGTNPLGAEATDVQPFAAGQAGWLRQTVDFDNGAGQAIYNYYSSTDGDSWTQIGTADLAEANTVVLFGSTDDLAIPGSPPALSAALRFTGRVYYAEVRDGAGTIIANPDFRNATPGAGPITDSTGKVWTLHGNASIESGTAAPARPVVVSQAARSVSVYRRQSFASFVDLGAPVAVSATEATVDPATLTLTGVTPTLTGAGTASAAADPAALALTGVDPALAGTGVVSRTADVAVLVLSGVDVTVQAGANIGVDPAVLTLTGVDVIATGTGTASVVADTATLTLTGVDPSLAGVGAVSTTADPAVLVLTGVEVGAFSGQLVTPASRTWRIPVSPRTLTVAADTRTYTVAADSRTLLVPAP